MNPEDHWTRFASCPGGVDVQAQETLTLSARFSSNHDFLISPRLRAKVWEMGRIKGPCPGSAAADGRQRQLPTGAASYSNPRKTSTPSLCKRYTLPNRVLTTVIALPLSLKHAFQPSALRNGPMDRLRKICQIRGSILGDWFQQQILYATHNLQFISCPRSELLQLQLTEY